MRRTNRTSGADNRAERDAEQQNTRQGWSHERILPGLLGQAGGTFKRHGKFKLHNRVHGQKPTRSPSKTTAQKEQQRRPKKLETDLPSKRRLQDHRKSTSPAKTQSSIKHNPYRPNVQCT